MDAETLEIRAFPTIGGGVSGFTNLYIIDFKANSPLTRLCHLHDG